MHKIEFSSLKIHILIQHYETNPPQYDHALSDKTMKYELDLILKTTEVKLGAIQCSIYTFCNNSFRVAHYKIDITLKHFSSSLN